MSKYLWGAIALAIATPALADEPPTGGGGCGDLCGPPRLPELPPSLVVSGNFSFPTTDPVDYYKGGIISNATPTYDWLPHAYWSYGASVPDADPQPLGSTPVVLGDAAGGVSFAVTVPSDGPAMLQTAAHTDGLLNGAGAYLTMQYVVTLTFGNMADADAFAAYQTAQGYAGSMEGMWSTSLSGYGSSTVIAQTADIEGHSGYLRRDCSRYDSGLTDLSGCGGDAYKLFTNFSRGDKFKNGDAMQFHSLIYLLSDAGVQSQPGPASATAFIDPVFKFGTGLQGLNVTLSVGGGAQGALAFVPEPAQWALMIGGFGLIGGTARRRRIVPA